MITIAVTTYACDVCGYKQEYPPTQDNVDLHFNSHPNAAEQNAIMLYGVFPPDSCPACWMNGLKNPLPLASQSQIQFNLLEASDVDKMEADEATAAKAKYDAIRAALRTPDQIAELRAKYEYKP